MKHEDNCQASVGTDSGRRGAIPDQPEGKEAPSGIAHNISPGMPCPETVLVAHMTDGSYLLMSYPHREPAASVVRDDAGSLRQALAEAFGSPTGEAATGNGNGKLTGTVVPGREALHITQARP